MNHRWIQTYTGKKFFPLDPKPQDVDVLDVAHALSLTCRFSGHVREFYSVAEHSCRVHDAWLQEATVLSADELFSALFHDAGEAYLADIANPIKDLVYLRARPFSMAEDKLLDVIAQGLGQPSYPVFKEVKHYDRVLLITEARDLLSTPPEEWEMAKHYVPLDERIVPWSPGKAKDEFLKRWHQIKQLC